MQWPYDSPGQTWLSAGDKGGYVLPTDSAKSPKEWPYNHKDLDDFVYRAEKELPTVDWTDGVWHGNAPPEGEDGDQVDKAAGGKA